MDDEDEMTEHRLTEPGEDTGEFGDFDGSGPEPGHELDAFAHRRKSDD